MPRKLLPTCVIALLLLNCGCQSYSPTLPPIQVVAAQDPPPPVPDAWWMEPVEPTLTADLLNELSASSSEVTGRSSR
ncbi:hypothetical protein DNK06_16185 [Pseudomonas daroniae]|uniref:Uncharacterized protein n=1 Tax=Phytopseudomonas daroniae TaxID=2487519 RepID=A0A4Q9QJB3_9GAMM|nr:hypothetical protein [Pseudomonas daroniae]TBU76408.1 hypothetical protein DNK10_10605 [Pseudomonas daroniae]TBU76827.1 hypothetical protein DNK06_16185 [Pseudomonas daroniae]TBU81398.1 hypothetical protein DNK31_14900 [Pseudomonas sp. FRB 228]TBU90396.1 hypothetical protein DNJ99_13195 [Pseudomonas daroniae]